jgi:hypothetical protein
MLTGRICWVLYIFIFSQMLFALTLLHCSFFSFHSCFFLFVYWWPEKQTNQVMTYDSFLHVIYWNYGSIK